MSGPRTRRAERGTSIVLFAMCLSTLVVFAALVIDFGQARSRVESDALSADEAALAGASSLPDGGDDACEAAWRYVQTNSGFAVAEVTTLPVCTSLRGTCNPAVSHSTTATWSDSTFTFTYPVPDGDPLLDGQPANTAIDLDGCNRFGVMIETTQHNIIDQGSLDLVSSAVAVNDLDPRVYADAAIVALAPSGCDIFTVGGSATVAVQGGAPGLPQIIIDSTGCESGTVLSSTSTGGVIVEDENGADGIIGMYALDGQYKDSAFDADQVPSKINATPTAIPAPVTRAPVDARYGDAIDDLVAAYGGSGAPAGFRKWSDYYPCSINNGDLVIVPSGDDWWVNCTLTIKGTLIIGGGNDLVFDSLPTPSGTGQLAIGCTDLTCDAATNTASTTMYVRAGSGNINGGTTTILNHTFVYTEADVTLDMNGTADLRWSAPDETTYPFDDLAWWTENSAETRINGTAELALEGVFFTPNKELVFVGNASTNAIEAQIWADKIDMSGTPDITLSPRAERLVAVPVPGGESRVSILIR